MNVENLKVLQLGKFYPIRGGVEKVAFDLMKGLSERGIECHMYIFRSIPVHFPAAY